MGMLQEFREFAIKGNAMDLAVGAKQVFVMMDLLSKTGESKLVKECSYPLTGLGCISRLYTDLAIFDLGPDGGDRGGQIIGVGTPEEIAELKESYTGEFLKKVLRQQ